MTIQSRLTSPPAAWNSERFSGPLPRARVTAVISLSAPLSRILRKKAQLSSRNRQTTNLGDARSHNVADLLTLRPVELHK
jgi:hypothetical protein